MSNRTTIARPYAKAAFELAIQHNSMSAWTKLLQTAGWVISQPKIQRFLQDPRYTAENHYSQLVDVCNTVMNEEGRKFFNLLASKDRLFILPEIADLFENYRVEHEKIIHVEVTSAFPLSASEQKHIAQALKIRLQREVTLHCNVDNALIGGTVIRAKDLVIDSSIRSQLARLKTALTS